MTIEPVGSTIAYSAFSSVEHDATVTAAPSGRYSNGGDFISGSEKAIVRGTLTRCVVALKLADKGYDITIMG